MMKLIDKVNAYIDKYQMIKDGDHVVAGISGGPDSVCLFFVLLKLQKQKAFSLTAVHINHGLRGEDADADERFVVELCEKYQVPLEIFRVDLELIAGKRKQSLEEAGREVRREAFQSVLEKYGGNRIALAHHQNDNAETLLWNLARGTGLHGLCGIRPVNGVWIRPLLCLERREIEQFLDGLGQDYCIDQTNLETAYTRNKLRHQVLPILENEVNLAAVRHMNETMEQMCMLREFAEEETKKAVQTCVTWDLEKETLEIVEKPWRELPVFLQDEVIYHCIQQIAGACRDLTRTHVAAVRQLLEKQTGKCRNLPGKIRAVRRYTGVLLEKNQKAATSFEKILQIPGVTVVPEKKLKITCRILEKEDGWKVSEIPQKLYTKWFDYDIIHSCLKLRGRESGDSIVIDQEGHRQKLKAWFVNEKIPADQRGEIPLIAEEDRIVWIVGHRMSTLYQVHAQTTRILQIEVELIDIEGDRGRTCVREEQSQ